jgi:hypothetical protein
MNTARGPTTPMAAPPSASADNENTRATALSAACTLPRSASGVRVISSAPMQAFPTPAPPATTSIIAT